MQVYVEFALLENFCMDFTLLYCAKLVCKNRAGMKRIAAASVLGAGFAVLFPLLNLNYALSAVLKILSGMLLALAAGKFKNFKGYLKFTSVFFAISAVLAGALLGIFSLTGLPFEQGRGYILSKVPIGIPLFGALCLILAARAIKNKFQKGGKTEVGCRIYAGEREVFLTGFFDSGNKVYLRGEPVSIIPEGAAKKIIDTARISDGVKVHTVAGSKIIKVFTADRLEIDYGDKKSVYGKVKIGISYAHIDCAVLHPDILED